VTLEGAKSEKEKLEAGRKTRKYCFALWNFLRLNVTNIIVFKEKSSASKLDMKKQLSS
jgi:hypothetical protein